MTLANDIPDRAGITIAACACSYPFREEGPTARNDCRMLCDTAVDKRLLNLILKRAFLELAMVPEDADVQAVQCLSRPSSHVT